jgi:serine protease Do/serine protease DegQ
MRRSWVLPRLLLAVAFVAALPAVSLPARAADLVPVPSLAPMLEKVIPGVVSIAVRGRVAVRANPLLDDPFFRQFFRMPEMPRYREFESMGSGVIVDAGRGFILTNAHVVDRADEIVVGLSDGRQLEGRVIGTDRETDVAVVQVPAENLKAVALGNSDTLRVGDYVIAVGNPFGLQQTVTSGIVSALGRKGLGIEGVEDFIQTDASINPGNSGGALVDLRGQLIGINTAIFGGRTNVGIGFAIPINLARQVMEQLVAHGSFRRGNLGVAVQDLTPDIAAALNATGAQGVVIVRIAPNSAAAEAGLQPGDVLLAVNGTAVRSGTELRGVIGLLPADARIDLTVLREGRQLTLKGRLTASGA